MSISMAGMCAVNIPVFVACGKSFDHKPISVSLVSVFFSHSFSGGIFPFTGIGAYPALWSCVRIMVGVCVPVPLAITFSHHA